MSYLTHLECSSCGKTHDADRLQNLCHDCGRPLLARYNLEAVRRALPREDLETRPASIWRYRELLPVRNTRFELTLGEGSTPLVRATRLSEATGVPNLFIKDEGNNPTGSFKARGLAVAVSRAWELGAQALSVPTAGNAGCAMSAYAALAGLEAHVYMPRDVPRSFAAECFALGAHVTFVDGLITDCGRAAARDAAARGDADGDGARDAAAGEGARAARFDMSTLKEPYRLEGKKTMGYEIAEQLGWKLPDVIVYPTGGGTGLIGMWKAFDEMESLGWIGAKRPRMVSVQPDGCAPIVRAFHGNADVAEAWEGARTVADGLRVPSAIGDFLMLRLLRKSEGTALAVTDGEMIEGANLIGRTQGMFVSPETGATVAALRKLREAGWIRPGEGVVLFNTGSGAKYAHLWAS
jgi:threonine synthase